MLDREDRARLRPQRRPGLPNGTFTAVMATIALLLALSCAPASADCTTGGSSCLPAGGGWVGRPVWNCGTFASTYTCYYGSSGTRLDWGFGSASDDAFVCVTGVGYFAGCAFDLARACYSPDCTDQDAVSFALHVTHSAGTARFVSGHGYY